MKDETHNNWGSASAEFTLDRDLASPLNGGGQVQPADGGTSKEARPFVLIQFDESTTVTLDSVELDDVEIASEFTEPEDNQFVYWPLSLMRGDHEVEVEAIDAAGNDRVFEFNFTVEERGDFLINLLAGWNAISVPADPGRYGDRRGLHRPSNRHRNRLGHRRLAHRSPTRRRMGIQPAVRSTQRGPDQVRILGQVEQLRAATRCPNRQQPAAAARELRSRSTRKQVGTSSASSTKMATRPKATPASRCWPASSQ